MNEEQEIRQNIEIFEVLMREMIQTKKVMQGILARHLRLQSIQGIPSIQNKDALIRAASHIEGISDKEKIIVPKEEIFTDGITTLPSMPKKAKKKKGG